MTIVAIVFWLCPLRAEHAPFRVPMPLVFDLHHNAVHEFKDWRTAPASPLPAWVDTGTATVDKSNLAVFREGLAAHPKPL